MGYRIVVSGIVQGVGYRNFSQLTAIQLGINGYAMNMPDSTVLIETDCTSSQLEAFKEKLFIGPPASKVENVDIARYDTETFPTFEIRYAV